MTITTEQSDDVCKIILPSRFGFNEISDFREAYSGVVAKEFVVDFRMTEHMDSSGLGMLLNLKRHIGDGVKVSLISCQPPVKKILMLSRFEKMFSIS